MKPIEAQDEGLRRWLSAYDVFDIEEFLTRVFPPAWGGIRARILETGATMSTAPCGWAPRWSPIPPTVRVGRCDDETRMRSIIYRVHDCLHQLWGLPHPGDLNSVDDFNDYKRAQMCGEVVVLTLTEFVYGRWLYESFTELAEWIEGRCAVRMLEKSLRGKSLRDLTLRLDEFLRFQRLPRWVREDESASAFAAYYMPMLQRDRDQIDVCWQAMKDQPGWIAESLRHAPKARFSNALNGTELTCWMVADFEQELWSSPQVDQALVDFNRRRRAALVLPRTWP